MKKSVLILVVLAITAIPAAGAFDYDTVHVNSYSQDYKLTIRSKIGPYDTSWYTGPTGRFVLDYGAFTGDTSSLLPYAYCVEVQTIQHNVLYNITDVSGVPAPFGPTDPADGGPMGTAKADFVRELWGRFEGLVNSNITGAAFALAMYEIVFEDLGDTWDVTSGKFKADYAYYAKGSDQRQAMKLANQWLSQLDGTGPMANLVGLTHNSRQDLVVEVPEPATLAILGLGGLAMMWKRRKHTV